MMDGGMMGGWGGFGLAGALINVLNLAGLSAWAVVKVFTTQGAESERSGAWMDPAEQTLRGRFARGEIDAEEYERSLKTLRGDSAWTTYDDYVRAVREKTAER